MRSGAFWRDVEILLHAAAARLYRRKSLDKIFSSFFFFLSFPSLPVSARWLGVGLGASRPVSSGPGAVPAA